MSADGGNKAVVAALSANLAIALVKFGAFALTGASSMLAEAIHSVADSGNQVLLLVGGRRAKKGVTPEHPFGYGRERYIFGFIVAVVLFSVGGLFALYEAYHKWHELRLGHADSLPDSRWWWVPLAVLVAAIVAEGLSFRTAVRESNRTRGRQSWVKFIRLGQGSRAARDPAGGLRRADRPRPRLRRDRATLLTGNGLFDVLGTALIGLLLVAVAVTLAIETKSLLLGESAGPEVVRRIEQALAGTDGVERVIHMKTLHMGPEEILVAAKIAVSPVDRAVEVAETIDRAEVAIRAAEPMVTSLYLEPDVYREDYTPAPRPDRPAAAGH